MKTGNRAAQWNALNVIGFVLGIALAALGRSRILSQNYWLAQPWPYMSPGIIEKSIFELLLGMLGAALLAYFAACVYGSPGVSIRFRKSKRK